MSPMFWKTPGFGLVKAIPRPKSLDSPKEFTGASWKASGGRDNCATFADSQTHLEVVHKNGVSTGKSVFQRTSTWYKPLNLWELSVGFLDAHGAAAEDEVRTRSTSNGRRQTREHCLSWMGSKNFASNVGGFTGFVVTSLELGTNNERSRWTFDMIILRMPRTSRDVLCVVDAWPMHCLRLFILSFIHPSF